jgi:RNA polymerase sigma-B factor
MLNIAALSAGTGTGRRKDCTELSVNALNVENLLSQTCLPTHHEFEKHVVNLVQALDCENQEVYNLEVEEAHTYYANGILVHNCDSTSQAINWLASKISAWAVSKVRRLQKSLASLGRETQCEQIALGLGISEEKWREIDAIDSNITVSLHELIYEPTSQLDEAESEQELISKHLANLQPLQRTAIVENFLHSTSIADIAKKQNKSQENIRAYINLGLTKIRISISKETL